MKATQFVAESITRKGYQYNGASNPAGSQLARDTQFVADWEGQPQLHAGVVMRPAQLQTECPSRTGYQLCCLPNCIGSSFEVNKVATRGVGSPNAFVARSHFPKRHMLCRSVCLYIHTYIHMIIYCNVI